MIELPDLDGLDQAEVDAAHAYLSGRLAEYAPGVDGKRGVVHDVILYLESVLHAGHDEAADRERRSGSILAISEDPTLADDDALDRLASNFGAARVPGSQAGGRVAVVIREFVPSSVPAGSVFVAQGVRFAAETSFAGRTLEAQVISETDRLVRPLGDGNFYYEIDLVAVENGVAGSARRGTRFEPESQIPYLVTAYALDDFTGGLDDESNADLVNRLKDGVSSKDPSSRRSVSALVRTADEFQSVLDVSSVGYGDPEQTRYHGLFPAGAGGRLDVYARTASLPASVRLEKTAVLVSHGVGGAVWQVTLAKGDAPGFYDVDRVVELEDDATGQTGYEVVEDLRGLDATGDGYVPDVTTAAEAAYSSYQTAVVRYLNPDTDASLAVGSTVDAVVYARAAPKIGPLQDYLGGRSVRPVGGDVLVRAPVPVDVVVHFTVTVPSGSPDPDVSQIALDVAAAANRTGFSGRLAASDLTAAAYRSLGAGQTTGPVDMFARLRRPDGTVKFLRSSAELAVPDEPSRGVSGRTACFYLDPADVSVAVRTSGSPEV